MFQRWISSRRSRATNPTANGPDLSAVPPFPAELDGGLQSVDPSVIGAYVGLPVVAVGALDSSSGGDGTPVEHPTLAALVAGQQEARRAVLRASGMSEDQIEIVVETISSAALHQHRQAWCVTFATGRTASVQVFPLGDGRGDFAGYRTRFQEQVAPRGRHPILDGSVTDIPEAHYETYRMGGVVVAMGRAHEAVVRTERLEGPRPDLTLAALAALGLWAVEG